MLVAQSQLKLLEFYCRVLEFYCRVFLIIFKNEVLLSLEFYTVAYKEIFKNYIGSTDITTRCR
jgi:hypothetical protein